jgi:hypothetical protein
MSLAFMQSISSVDLPIGKLDPAASFWEASTPDVSCIYAEHLFVVFANRQIRPRGFIRRFDAASIHGLLASAAPARSNPGASWRHPLLKLITCQLGSSVATTFTTNVTAKWEHDWDAKCGHWDAEYGHCMWLYMHRPSGSVRSHYHRPP